MKRLDAPLAFRPILRERVWGGHALKSRVANPPQEPVGESWEISDVAEAISVLVDGSTDLRTLVETEGDALIGDAWDESLSGRFPLLVKLLETREVLSVQVHPDDAQARARGGLAAGKTEAWYVLAAEPGAFVLRGVKEGVSRAGFEHALREDTCQDALVRYEPRVGDAIFVPAGTIHAIGPGLRLVEIQQSSDTTYRLFDWNRPGLDGKPRALHIADGLDVTMWQPSEPAPSAAAAVPIAGCRRVRLVDHEKLQLDELSRFDRGRCIDLTPPRPRFVIAVVVRGRARLIARGGALERGPEEIALVPAAARPWSLEASEDAVVLIATRP